MITPETVLVGEYYRFSLRAWPLSIVFPMSPESSPQGTGVHFAGGLALRVSQPLSQPEHGTQARWPSGGTGNGKYPLNYSCPRVKLGQYTLHNPNLPIYLPATSFTPTT